MAALTIAAPVSNAVAAPVSAQVLKPETVSVSAPILQPQNISVPVTQKVSVAPMPVPVAVIPGSNLAVTAEGKIIDTSQFPMAGGTSVSMNPNTVVKQMTTVEQPKVSVASIIPALGGTNVSMNPVTQGTNFPAVQTTNNTNAFIQNATPQNTNVVAKNVNASNGVSTLFTKKNMIIGAAVGLSLYLILKK